MNPLFVFLLLFVGIPLAELYFLIEVGSQIGAFATIVLTVFTAVLGGLLVRLQGFTTALRVRDAMDRGEMPAIEMIEGAVLLVCGLLLLLPGFFTDAFGFLCLVPPVRRGLIVWLLGRSGVMRPGGPVDGADPRQSPGSRRVIEGEYRREDED